MMDQRCFWVSFCCAEKNAVVFFYGILAFQRLSLCFFFFTARSYQSCLTRGVGYLRKVKGS